MTRVTTVFLVWRLSQGKRQIDIEFETGIKKWKVGLFEVGHAVLDTEEIDRLSKLTGMSPDRLQQPIESETDSKISKTKTGGPK